MEKLRFECEVVADEDPKTNTIIIKSITDEDGKKFHIPQYYQPLRQHTELLKLPEFKSVVNTLKKRGQCRNVWVRLHDEIRSLYKDESGNIVIKDYLLEDISILQQTAPSTSEKQTDETLMKLLAKLCEREETEKEYKNRNANKLYEKFVLDKFEGRKASANQWLQTYESECERLGINSDLQKIEVLRLFLDDAGKDWFNSMLIKHSLNSEWRTWKENFLQTFADKGWSSVTYALNYKYFTGSILEYALKKEHLLLESNKNMDNRTLVDLIADGLPTFIRNKIDREITTTPVNLFSELRKYENIMERKPSKINENKPKMIKTETRSNFKRPCRICESRGNKDRYHPEDSCWFKEDRNKGNEKNRITNTILEFETTEDPKKLDFPPLVEVKVLLNENTECKGIYDPGSNITLINSRLVKIKNLMKQNFSSTIKTISGRGKTNGLITLNAEILNIKNKINAFVYDNDEFNYDLILGLDTIKKFGLTHDGNLNIQLQKEIKSKLDNDDVSKDKLIMKDTIIRNNNKSVIRNKEEIEMKNTFDQFQVNFNEGINIDEFNIDIEHLKTDQRSKINTLLDNYKSIFAKDKYDVGKVKNYEAFIDLQVDKYCYKRPYRCSLKDKAEIEEQVAELLKHNLIEESYSPFAAPITLAYKRDEGKKTRLCIDFRDINKLIIPQSQPFPLIEDLMTKTIDCKFFTTLDINSAFWSIPLRIRDRQKTAFVTQEGHYQWTCLPFGLKTSPAIFQRILVNIIRKHNLSNFVVNYIDDIMIFSKTLEEHLDHLKRLLDAIVEEGFRLKLTKCRFAANSVKYLGHIITENTVTPLKDNLKSIIDFPAPQNRKQIRQFLGKVNFYGKYIPNVSVLLDPLHNLLRKNVKFDWSNNCKIAFSKVKEYLCSKPILAIYNHNAQTFIYTDASIKGIGAILKQTQKDGTQKPVAYFSKKLSDSQKKKKAIFLECLAIKESLKFWQHWLIGNAFTVYTDHRPLQNLNIKNRTDDELGDMTHYLSQYNFRIIYNPGKENTEADCLSRNPVYEHYENEEDRLKTVNFISIEDIQNDQKQNTSLRNKYLIKENNIYYKQNKNKKRRIVLSEYYSKIVIKKIHEEFCHIGINQIETKMKPFYTAPNLSDNIRIICKSCDICIKNKTRLNKKFGLMSHLGPAERPFQIMSLDTIGGFGGKRSTKRYLHLLVDHFTRFAYILCSKNQLAKDFIKLIEKASNGNVIEILLADQYPAINSKEFKTHLKEKNIELVFTATDAPFSNGLNERLNQTLVNRIRCMYNNDGKKKAWPKIAEECVNAYNKTVHTVTGFSPIYLMNGESTDLLPPELKIINDGSKDLEQDRKIALLRSKKSHEYNKTLFDKNRIKYEFQKGDMVYVTNGNKLNRNKMDEIRIGPFEIEERISDSIFKINTGSGRKSMGLYHVTKLIPVAD